jgi:hypothetical protein
MKRTFYFSANFLAIYQSTMHNTMAFILYISPYSELDLQHQLNLLIILTTFHGTLNRRHHVSGRLEGNVFRKKKTKITENSNGSKSSVFENDIKRIQNRCGNRKVC